MFYSFLHNTDYRIPFSVGQCICHVLQMGESLKLPCCNTCDLVPLSGKKTTTHFTINNNKE